MTTFRSIRRRGYTLIELTIAVFIGLAVAATTLVLANQQFTFLRIYAAQNFLTEEAPVISMYMNRLVGQAERYRLHTSLANAQAGTNPVMTNATVMVLFFQQPDGTTRSGILAWQNIGAGNGLYYYVVPVNGVITTPSWVLTKRPSNVRFSIENGILRNRITGPNGEVITYSGTMQQ